MTVSKNVYVCQVGDDKDSSSSCDKTATTTFAADGEVAALCYEKPIDKVIPSVGYDTIESFLERPWLASNVTWQESDLRNSIIYQTSVAPLLIANPSWEAKLRGFNLIRATVHFRVVINAQPFQQGMLMLHFLPQYDEMLFSNPSYVSHNMNITTKSQQPSMLLDVRESAAIFSMPYISPSDFYNRETNIFGWGRFFITVVSPLDAGTTNFDARVSVYVNFTDVEFGAPMVSQSSVAPRKGFGAKVIESSTLTDGGTISNALRATSKVISGLHAIPSLSSVAAPASWVAGTAAGLASSLGYSKPDVEDGITTMAKVFDRYGSVADGNDASIPLGISATNSVSRSAHFSVRDDDEMSWNYLKTRSALIPASGASSAAHIPYNWSSTNASGDTIASFRVSPRGIFALDQVVHTNTTIVATGPPCYYLANLFTFWRGSMKFKMKLVKTDFHTGRLQVTFTPAKNNVPIMPTLQTSDVSLREIIDIRTADEFEFITPFMQESSYLLMSEWSGVLEIKVLNPLRSPETTSQSIDLWLVVGGGDDLEFQAPGGYQKTALAYSAQVNDLHTKSPVLSESVGGVSVPDVGLHCAEESMGEYFSSIRQLLLRYNQVYYRTEVSIGEYATLSIWPYFIGMRYMTGAGAQSSPNLGGDIHSYLAPMYAYYKGGMRYKISTAVVPTAAFGTRGINNSVTVSNDLANYQPATAPFKYGTLNAGAPIVGTWGTTNWTTAGVLPWANGVAITDAGLGFVSVKAPYYSKYKCSLVIPQSNIDQIPGDGTQSRTNLTFTSFNSFYNYSMYRAIAEDFQFSYFIGCPPVYIS